MEPVAQATDDDGLICAASVTQNRPKLNHAPIDRIGSASAQPNNAYCPSANPDAASSPPGSLSPASARCLTGLNPTAYQLEARSRFSKAK